MVCYLFDIIIDIIHEYYVVTVFYMKFYSSLNFFVYQLLKFLLFYRKMIDIRINYRIDN